MFAGALPSGMTELIDAGLVPTIVDRAGAEAVAATGPASVYVKVNAGLGRLGVPLEDAEAFLDGVHEMPGIEAAGLYTHLPFARADGRDWAQARLAAFDALLDRLDRRNRLPAVTQAKN